MKDGVKHVCYLYLIFILIIVNMHLYAKQDTSLRIDQVIYGTINDRSSIISYAFEQINENISEYNYMELGTGLQNQTPLSRLSLLIHYQQSYSENEEGDRELEQKPSLNINTPPNLPVFAISHQIRYEYRSTPQWDDYIIKNNLAISLHDTFLHSRTGW